MLSGKFSRAHFRVRRRKLCLLKSMREKSKFTFCTLASHGTRYQIRYLKLAFSEKFYRKIKICKVKIEVKFIYGACKIADNSKTSILRKNILSNYKDFIWIVQFSVHGSNYYHKNLPLFAVI